MGAIVQGVGSDPYAAEPMTASQTEIYRSVSVRSEVWRPPERDVPAQGLPLTRRVERLAAPIRTATAELVEAAEARHEAIAARWLSAPNPRLEANDGSSAMRERFARAAVAAWLVAYLRRVELDSDATSSIRAASQWFWGFSSETRDPPALRAVRLAIDRNGFEEAEALLPYVLDPFGLTTRRSMLSGTGDAKERSARKVSGTFYTPGDVARLLADETITSASTSVIDPACGAGVFLRAAFTRLCALGASAREATGQLYGLDLDPRAVDACGFVLAHDWLARVPDHDEGVVGARWRAVRLNLAVGNALEAFAAIDSFDTKTTREHAAARAAQRERVRSGAGSGPMPIPSGATPLVWRYFPERAERRFDCALINPPYAPAGSEVTSEHRLISSYESLTAGRTPSTVNLAWPFVEIGIRAVGSFGSAGIVLPLSLSYRTDRPTSAVRTLMALRGAWRLRFYDRAPDAIFGDDVKQRVCLATMQAGEEHRIETSRLARWSTSRRADVLRADVGEFQRINMDCSGLFPKIGTRLEAEAFDRLRGEADSLGSATVEASLRDADDLLLDPRTVVVAPTAYNWIGTYRDTVLAQKARGRAVAKVSALTFADPEQADAAYALLSSRIFLWWWRVTADLFHVRLGSLVAAPFPLRSVAPPLAANMAAAGRRLWRAAERNPVYSTNRGVVVTAYPAPANCGQLLPVDKAVVNAFELPSGLVRVVRNDATRLAIAGRDR
jgi:N-6 DNA Methylase